MGNVLLVEVDSPHHHLDCCDDQTTLVSKKEEGEVWNSFCLGWKSSWFALKLFWLWYDCCELGFLSWGVQWVVRTTENQFTTEVGHVYPRCHDHLSAFANRACGLEELLLVFSEGFVFQTALWQPCLNSDMRQERRCRGELRVPVTMVIVNKRTLSWYLR